MDDYFFNSILSFLHKYMSGEPIDIREYMTERPYYLMLEKGYGLLLDGVSDCTLQIVIEFEKAYLVKNSDLSEKDLMAILFIEKIIYIIHGGELSKAADIVHHFASDEIKTKYAKTIEILYKIDAEMMDGKTIHLYLEDQQKDLDSENSSLFYHRFMNELIIRKKYFLFRDKVLTVKRMLGAQFSDVQIVDSLGVEESFYHIMKKGIDQNKDIHEIAQELAKMDHHVISSNFEYQDLSTEDAILVQMVDSYREHISLSYEAKLVKIIRKVVLSNQPLSNLDIDKDYIDKVVQYIKKNPSLSDNDVAYNLIR